MSVTSARSYAKTYPIFSTVRLSFFMPCALQWIASVRWLSEYLTLGWQRKAPALALDSIWHPCLWRHCTSFWVLALIKRIESVILFAGCDCFHRRWGWKRKSMSEIPISLDTVAKGVWMSLGEFFYDLSPTWSDLPIISAWQILCWSWDLLGYCVCISRYDVPRGTGSPSSQALPTLESQWKLPALTPRDLSK